ncbi:hypothetical protein N9H34_01090 [bacterium]|nr:hypothetical protein [bacterium]
MKICLITNYTREYINDLQIFHKLLETLELSSRDVFNISSLNSVYNINDDYTHSLVLLDFKSTNISLHKQFLSEVNIPRIFIIDTIPKIQKDLDITFNKELRNSNISHLTSLPFSSQLFLYEQYADGLVFYSSMDQNHFGDIYPIKNPIPSCVIPPSLGSKEDIQIDFSYFSPNNNIGFNGSPSFSNGIYHLFDALVPSSNYNVNIFGSHGRNELSNEILVNHITKTSSYIKFKGRLKDPTFFFKENHIYHNISIYDSFNYFTFTSLLNGMVPILSYSTSTAEYFPSYPFISDIDSNSINNTLEKILSTPTKELKDILLTTVLSLKHLNNKDLKKEYFNFLNSIA